MAQPVSPVIPGREDAEVKVAENQPQYITMPTLFLKDEHVTALTRWELTDEELELIQRTKSVYLWMATFGRPVTPVRLTVESLVEDAK